MARHPELAAERAAEIKKLAQGDKVPLDLLVRSNLIQQELTRLGINSIALLNKTVSKALDVMQELRNLNHRKVGRQSHEGLETMRKMTITEKTEKIGRCVERDCRSVVNQLVYSILKDVLFRPSYVEHQQLIITLSAQGISVELKSNVAKRLYSLIEKRSTSRARTVLAEMRLCPGIPLRKVIQTRNCQVNRFCQARPG